VVLLLIIAVMGSTFLAKKTRSLVLIITLRKAVLKWKTLLDITVFAKGKGVLLVVALGLVGREVRTGRRIVASLAVHIRQTRALGHERESITVGEAWSMRVIERKAIRARSAKRHAWALTAHMKAVRRSLITVEREAWARRALVEVKREVGA